MNAAPDLEQVRDDVRTWLAANWHGRDDEAWRTTLLESGWSAPSWPAGRYGRGLPRAASKVVAEEFAAVGAPGGAYELTPFREHSWLTLLGNTLLSFGSDEQCAEFLPRLLRGEIRSGCLLYSEPGAGSDLASLQTRAERRGDHYVVTGQKIWTTRATEAEFALLLARTDWDVPKHAGLSFFVMPMDLPGIEIRPIRQITGEAEFNEVFLHEVPVPASALVGAEGDGWKVLQVPLAAERSGMASLGAASARPRAGHEIADVASPLIKMARDAGRSEDPVIRQELMKVLSWRLTNTWTGQRAMAELQRGSSSLASLGKLAMSRVLHSSTELAFRLQGADSLVYDYEDPLSYPVDRDMMFAFINSIGGGSDQIQRNIISERVLGLPKGPEPDKGVPFREVRKGSDTRSLG